MRLFHTTLFSPFLSFLIGIDQSRAEELLAENYNQESKDDEYKVASHGEKVRISLKNLVCCNQDRRSFNFLLIHLEKTKGID